MDFHSKPDLIKHFPKKYKKWKAEQESKKRAIESESQKLLAIEKQKLLKEIARIDDDDKLHDEGYIYEYHKKRQELEKKEIDISFSMRSLEIQRQVVELTERINLQEMNKKELELMQKMLSMTQKDLQQEKKLIEMTHTIGKLERTLDLAKQKELSHHINRQRDLLERDTELRRIAQEYNEKAFRAESRATVIENRYRGEKYYDKLKEDNQELIKEIAQNRKEMWEIEDRRTKAKEELNSALQKKASFKKKKKWWQ
jgi:hypothetical protein